DMAAASEVARVDQQLVFAVDTFPHVKAWLLLPRKSFAEEIAVAGLLDRIITFNVEELADAIANASAPRQIIQVGACVARLLGDPLGSGRRILILQPTVRIGDRQAMKYLGDGLGACEWGLGYDRHVSRPCSSSLASRCMRRVMLRRNPPACGSLR